MCDWAQSPSLTRATSVLPPQADLRASSPLVSEVPGSDICSAANWSLFDCPRRGAGCRRHLEKSLHQSALAPENFTTFAHFCVSSEMNVPKSADEPVSIMPPSSVSLVFSLGAARPALISLLSLSMISAGVFFGAPTPYQVLAL